MSFELTTGMKVEEYSIPTRAAFEWALPEGAKFLAAGVRGDGVKAWFAVPKTYCETHARHFAVVLADGDIPFGYSYLATLPGKHEVAHLFVFGTP